MIWQSISLHIWGKYVPKPTMHANICWWCMMVLCAIKSTCGLVNGWFVVMLICFCCFLPRLAPGACPSPPGMAPGCLPFSSLNGSWLLALLLLGYLLVACPSPPWSGSSASDFHHHGWLGGEFVLCWDKGGEACVSWVVWAVRLCPPLLWLYCWLLAFVDSTKVHAVTKLLVCSLPVCLTLSSCSNG
jgi:hypothetical protein